MINLLQLFAHPRLLILAGLLCIPALWPIARFIFEDFETFKAQAGLSRELDQKLWILGFCPSNPYRYVKITCFFGAYFAIVVAVYQILVRVVGRF